MDIRISRDERPSTVQIIDDGRKAYLSKHELGAGERDFKLIDCTKVSKRNFDYVTDIVLGDYKKDIEQRFGQPQTKPTPSPPPP